jgi:hypothetical protein
MAQSGSGSTWWLKEPKAAAPWSTARNFHRAQWPGERIGKMSQIVYRAQTRTKSEPDQILLLFSARDT